MLTVPELYQQKTIFEDVLVRELLYEVKFLHDQMAERAIARKDFKDQVLEAVTKLITKGIAVAAAVVAPPAVPFVSIAGTVVELTSERIGNYLGQNKEAAVMNLGNLFNAEDMTKLEVYFRQFAKAASLRYEWLLAIELSKKPDEGVIPLARDGARRVIEYLCRVTNIVVKLSNDKFPQFPLTIEMLLEGLIQGRSGKWIDGFQNTHLKGRPLIATNLTTQGAYGRSAMRLLPQGKSEGEPKNWPIYYTLTSRHQKEGKDKYYDWGRVKLVEDGQLTSGPKYGYMLVDDATRQAYGYTETFGTDISEYKFYNNYPTVKIVGREDVLAYNTYMASVTPSSSTSSEFKQKTSSTASTIPKGEKPYRTFLQFIQDKYQTQHCRIDQVWVKDANFSKEKLRGGDYTDIGFSGCLFEETTLEDMIMCRSNLTFIKARKCIVKNVNLDQANACYSDFREGTFDHVTYVGTQWMGALLDGLRHLQPTAASNNDLIKKMKADQEQQAQAVNKKIWELQQKVERFEVALLQQHQEMLKGLNGVGSTLTEQTQAIKELYEQINQAQLDHRTFQVYCEIQLETLKDSMTSLTLEQNEFKTKQAKAIATLQQQVQGLTEAQEQFQTLASSLQQTLAEEPLSAERLTALNQTFTKLLEELRGELYEEIYALKDRVNAIEADLEEVRDTMGVSNRQTVTVHAFEGNILAEGAKANYGDARVNFLKVKKGAKELTTKEQSLAETLAKEAIKANMKVFAYRHNRLAKDSEMNTGDAEVNVVFLDHTEETAASKQRRGQTSTTKPTMAATTDAEFKQEPVKFPTPPATLKDKQLIAQVRALLDQRYSAEAALGDEEINQYRQQILADLTQVAGHPLSRAEKTKLQKHVDDLTPSEDFEVKRQPATTKEVTSSTTMQKRDKVSYAALVKQKIQQAKTTTLGSEASKPFDIPSFTQVSEIQLTLLQPSTPVQVIFHDKSNAEKFSQELYRAGHTKSDGSPLEVNGTGLEYTVNISDKLYNQLKSDDEAYEKLKESGVACSV